MSALPTSGREWHLVARPHGWPKPEDFALREAAVTEPGEGQLLVRNLYFSVDPYMRGRMNDVKSYTPPFQLDQPMEGGAVGEVIASNAEGFAVGDHVLHFKAGASTPSWTPGRPPRWTAPWPPSPPTWACSACRA